MDSNAAKTIDDKPAMDVSDNALEESESAAKRKSEERANFFTLLEQSFERYPPTSLCSMTQENCSTCDVACMTDRCDDCVKRPQPKSRAQLAASKTTQTQDIGNIDARDKRLAAMRLKQQKEIAQKERECSTKITNLQERLLRDHVSKQDALRVDNALLQEQIDELRAENSKLEMDNCFVNEQNEKWHFVVAVLRDKIKRDGVDCSSDFIASKVNEWSERRARPKSQTEPEMSQRELIVQAYALYPTAAGSSAPEDATIIDALHHLLKAHCELPAKRKLEQSAWHLLQIAGIEQSVVGSSHFDTADKSFSGDEDDAAAAIDQTKKRVDKKSLDAMRSSEDERPDQVALSQANDNREFKTPVSTKIQKRPAKKK